ncbi:ATPase AAA [Rhizobium leguminosarum]|uniref:AAA family ATPase n=1 Tax=Rhizobium leguminosarum TaxID=384 RepID=A0A444IN58_RHILE|nr:ATPase AAA [Rhizobium leguminosarum]MDH6659299.1 adenylate kinase family enzyme [Rhizobium sophorae]ASS53857.1 AAA family ATPase [Rhizobium leguminosarum bv. viciae]AVC48891.1 AAA domain protein [Rhizobium leguminosarum bv. viciae]MBB4327650.1 adenylate kinase family enzyme [Rhizobium leguminosarum]MBB4340978.1 adenylate kinase family enzyme [Rhizobium leguminosarum]
MTFPNPSATFDRMLIMGNGGAGKSWLARRVGEQLHHPVVHLDDMHWEPGRYGIDRDRALRDEMVKAAAEGNAWVMEGVYGQLANMVLNRTTILVWIDLPEEECIANIKLRGIQGGETGTQFDGLLKWVAEYRSRTNNWNSFETHARLFSVFTRPKFLLSSREAVTDFADRLSTSIDEAADERAQISE